MTRIRDLHDGWMKSPAYREAYEALEEEFAIATALIHARARAGLTQGQLARRMKTSQSAIARLESGRTSPSARTLMKFAEATGSRLRIALEPATQSGKRSSP
jgi:transcriptional regulator with XRE-family HTH domain